MKFLIILSFFFCFKAFSIVGHDDRFYVHDTKWADLLNGIVQIDGCTGFVLEGDVIVTAAHCFENKFYLDENDREISYELVTKDSKINYKNLKRIAVYFGDLQKDPNDKTQKTYFDTSSISYRIKDLFLGQNLKLTNVSLHDFFSKDYAFIKLKHPIPKKIKRFKLFNSDLLKEYEILKHSYRGNLSTAGYHGDNTKTMHQRMAHIGCKARDLRKYKKVWFEFTDCDTYDGGSGSPLFYILRHKKTKKIELAVSSLLIGGNTNKREGRVFNEYLTHETPKYLLGWGYHYHIPIFSGYFSASFTLSLTNHKEFYKNLIKFKRNPSFFKGQKLKRPPYNKYYDPKWLLKKIQKTPLKDFKEFIEKSILNLKKIDPLFADDFIDYLKYFYEKNKEKISKKKMRILVRFYEDNLIETERKKVEAYDSFYSDPSEKRTKQFSYKKLTELKDKFERKEPDTYEDSIDDKEKAQKLWKMYFGK